MIDPNDVDMKELIRTLRKDGDTATLIYSDGKEEEDYAVIITPRQIAQWFHDALHEAGSPTKVVPDSVVPLKYRN